jgi:hypothetical protein
MGKLTMTSLHPESLIHEVLFVLELSCSKDEETRETRRETCGDQLQYETKGMQATRYDCA